MTVSEYILYWYETYKRMNHAATTSEATLSRIRTHILGSRLGRMELNAVLVKDIQEFILSLSQNGNKSRIGNFMQYGKQLSNATVSKIRQILICAFRQAEKEELISFNPAFESEGIKIPHKETRAFTKEETKRFLNYTKNHRHYAAYLLLFSTGLRRSELLALSWDDIDTTERVLRVRKTLVIEGSIPTVRDMTKTPKSVRNIPIPMGIIQALGNVRERQTSEEKTLPYWSNPNNLIFTKKNGECLNPSSFSRNFKNILKSLGFSNELHLHSTRHTWATRMVQLGIPLTDIQKLGGWTTSRMLLEIYSHTVQESQRIAMESVFDDISVP